jgi:pilus assembly protein FimV
MANERPIAVYLTALYPKPRSLALPRAGARMALRTAATLLLACLLCLPAWAQTPPAPPSFISPSSGQTPSDIALGQVPAGISFEQFLLALLHLNPQLSGPSQALQGGLKLQLPSAAQATAVSPEQARAQLLALSRTSPIPGPNASAAAALLDVSQPAPSPSGAASEASGQASAPQPAAGASAPATVAPSASQPGRLIDPWMLISVGAALLVILLLVFKRKDGERAPPPLSKAPAPRWHPAQTGPVAEPSQGLFRPSLPDDGGPRTPRGQPVTPTSAPPPAMAKLSDLGPLPSLDLGDPAPAPRQAAPAAVSTGPLDLIRISLDLNDPPKREP